MNTKFFKHGKLVTLQFCLFVFPQINIYMCIGKSISITLANSKGRRKIPILVTVIWFL